VAAAGVADASGSFEVGGAEEIGLASIGSSFEASTEGRLAAGGYWVDQPQICA